MMGLPALSASAPRVRLDLSGAEFWIYNSLMNLLTKQGEKV